MRLRWLLLALIFVAQSVPAQNGKNANGVFLVADPGLRDPNFRHSVVLVTQMPDGGSIGFIVNRRGERSLAEILPEHELLKRYTEPLYLGGPVEASGLFAMLRTRKAPAGALPVLEEVAFAMEPAVLEQVLQAPPPQVRFFNGYAGWAPGQLASELARGGWRVVHADADTVFRSNMDTLWEELMRRSRGVVAAAPDQLSGVNSDTPSRARRVSHGLGR